MTLLSTLCRWALRLSRALGVATLCPWWIFSVGICQGRPQHRCRVRAGHVEWRETAQGPCGHGIANDSQRTTHGQTHGGTDDKVRARLTKLTNERDCTVPRAACIVSTSVRSQGIRYNTVVWDSTWWCRTRVSQRSLLPAQQVCLKSTVQITVIVAMGNRDRGHPEGSPHLPAVPRDIHLELAP